MKKKTSRIRVIGFAIIDGLCLVIFALSLLFTSAGKSEGKQRAELPDFEENYETYGDLEEMEGQSVAVSVSYRGAAADSSPRAVTPEPTIPPAPTAVPTPAPAPAAANSSYAGFIFPNSNTELITTSQIDQYANTKATCQRAVSELFARYGYQFKNPDTTAFFNQYSWYVSMAKRTDMEGIIKGFNSIERANFDTLRAYEDAHGWG